MPSSPGYEFTHRHKCAVRTPRIDLSLLAATLRDRGSWIPVLMDAEARRRPKAEGLRIAQRLNEIGVEAYCAQAETGAMVEEIANRLSTGRLRVHDHLEEWFAGYWRYRRDDKGEINACGFECDAPDPPGPLRPASGALRARASDCEMTADAGIVEIRSGT